VAPTILLRGEKNNRQGRSRGENGNYDGGEKGSMKKEPGKRKPDWEKEGVMWRGDGKRNRKGELAKLTRTVKREVLVTQYYVKKKQEGFLQDEWA